MAALISALLAFSADQIRNEPSLMLLFPLFSPFFFLDGRFAALATSLLCRLCVAIPLLDLELELLPLAGMYTTNSRACDLASAMAVVRGVLLPSNMCCSVDDAVEVEDDESPPRICRYCGMHSCSDTAIIPSLVLVLRSTSSSIRLSVGDNAFASR